VCSSSFPLTKRDGAIVAPPRRTYSSPEAPDDVRDTYRDAVDAALKRNAIKHLVLCRIERRPPRGKKRRV
jgi:hypothetical protein